MALFGFGRKKEENKAAACACNGGCEGAAAAETLNDCRPVAPGGELRSVKVLGSGCRACHELLENTRAALGETGAAIEAEYITDMQKIMEYGVMHMPALVINERVAATGRVLKAAEIVKLLRKLGF